jgi:hypothetical protein
MSEIILSTDSLTVLGGPATLDVEVDFGPQGDRGSYIFVGEGDPNLPSTTIGQDPEIFDLYINLLNDPISDYLALYQYQNVDGETEWTKLARIIPNIYSSNRDSIPFNDGVANINIQVSAIVSLDQIANISSENFNIQYNILNDKPVSSSLTVGELSTSGGILTLPLTIKAIEYDSGTWSNIDTTKTVHLFISVV